MAVYKKLNGKWYCRGRVKGERYHRLCDGATSRQKAMELEDALRYKIRQRQNGLIEAEEAKYKLDYLAKLYLDYSEANNKDLKHTKCKVRYFIKYFGGNTYIHKILPKDIENFKLHLINKKSANATVNRYFSSLHKMFNIAIENDLLIKNPCRNMKKLIEDNEVMNVFTPQEEINLHKNLKPWIDDIVTVAFATGFRKTNIRLLKWTSINFDFKYIEIPAHCFKGGKAHAIPMTKELEKIFKRNKNLTEYVFIKPETGRPYSDDDVSDAFKEGCKRANLINKRFHDIRHTVATRLLENGEDIITVKELLGHSTVTVTQKYTHTNINKKRDALSRLTSYR